MSAVELLACVECGGPITKRRRGGPALQYCSRTCGYRVRGRRKREAKRFTGAEVVIGRAVCATCGDEFLSRGAPECSVCFADVSPAELDVIDKPMACAACVHAEAVNAGEYRCRIDRMMRCRPWTDAPRFVSPREAVTP